MNWIEIDLILDEFGVATSESWQGDTTSYLAAMLRGVSDDRLKSLSDHFGIEVGADAITDVPKLWKGTGLKVFISHLSDYKTYASALQSELSKYGILAFVAHEDIIPSAEWQDEIETALKTCNAVIALLHPGFEQSDWTDQEVGFGLGRGVPVFSIQLGKLPYGFIAKIQAFKGIDRNISILARELFDCYRTHRRTSGIMSDAIVALFERSSSFREAKERCGWLEEIGNWHSGYAQRLRDAVSNNRQISDAHGVKERIETLIANRDPATTGSSGYPFDEEIPF